MARDRPAAVWNRCLKNRKAWMNGSSRQIGTAVVARVTDVMWLAGLISVFFLAKVLTRSFGLHVPGASMALWLPALLVARWRVDRPGSALAVSVGGAIVASLPRWVSAGWLLGYAVAAIPVELALPLLVRRTSTLVAFVATGLLAGLFKAGLKVALPGAGVAAYGASAAVLTHLLFGALAGLVAYAVCRAAGSRSH